MEKFNTWERYFDPKHPKHIYQVNRHNWLMKRVAGPRLLDIGCSGGLALYLAGQNENIMELYGVDIDSEKIFLAAERLKAYGNKKIDLRVCKGESTTHPDNMFNCVICGETLEHVKDDKVLIDEIYRVTAIGGTVLITVPKEGHLSKMHVRLYIKESLWWLVKNAGFNIIEEDEMKASVNGYYLLLKAVK